MAIEQTVVKTLVLTGPITLYEVSAVCETLRIASIRGKAAADRFERFRALGPCRPAGSDLVCPECAESRSGSSPGRSSGGVCPGCRTIRVVRLAPFRSRVTGRDAVANPTILMSKTVLHADDSAAVRRWVAEQLGR